MPAFLLRVLVATALVMASVSGAADASKILKRGNGAEPYSLDPHRAVMTAENNVIGDMLMGLYTEDKNGQPVLGAAESVETSPDGLTWTFRIRAHNWSDGKPVSAGDFVYAFQRVLAPETAAEYASVLYPIKNAQAFNKGEVRKDRLGVNAPNPSTLVITLEHAAPFLPELLTHYTTFPVPKSYLEKFGSEWTRPGKMVVNGPYVLSEWRPHDHIRLIKNARFYDAASVKIDEVFFYPSDDDNTALRRYRAGELDTQERWPTTEYKWLKTHIPDEARRAPQLSINFVSFNLKRKPFDDYNVRKAVAMSIDNEALSKRVLLDVYGEAAYGFLPPGTANVDLDAKVPWHDIPILDRQKEARKILAAAGFNSSAPLKFTYRYINVPDIKKAAVALQAMWRAVGIQVELQASEAKVHWNLLEVHDFEAAHNSWSLDYNDAKNLFFTFQIAAEQLNSSWYASEIFENFLREADGEPDSAKRARLLGNAHAQLIADIPSVPLMFPYQRHLVKSYVVNWVSNPRAVNRTRWLDLGDKSASPALPDVNAEKQDGFFDWVASWFSADAWSKWWNN
jgi:oligopeptide transport system substrate-binding protein